MKICKLTTFTCIVASFFSTTSFAYLSLKGEDMPTTVTAPHNWTGFYAGLNAGAVNHTMNITDTQAVTFNATIQQVSNPKLTGGFQVGYRRQVDLTKASGVYGAELSANFANATFNKQYGSAFALYQLNAENKLQTLCLLQLTGGIAADKTLLFIAAGLSWANLSGNVTNVDGVPFFNSFNVGKKELGTAISGGIEYAYNDNISGRFKVDVITPNTYSTLDNAGNSYEISNTIVQGTVGVNYKFI